jgi:hypothetical protein
MSRRTRRQRLKRPAQLALAGDDLRDAVAAGASLFARM